MGRAKCGRYFLGRKKQNGPREARPRFSERKKLNEPREARVEIFWGKEVEWDVRIFTEALREYPTDSSQ